MSEDLQRFAVAVPAQRSAVQVVGGRPDDVEVAALVAGLAAVAGANGEPEVAPVPQDQWESRARRLGTSPAVRSADQWRWSLHA